MTLLRIALGTMAIALGVGALVLAYDIRSWNAAFDGGDTAFAARPSAASWSTEPLLPGDVALRVLALRDDLSVRRGEQAFAATVASPGLDDGRLQERRRGLAELALSDVVATGSPTHASRAGNLLGILAATGPPSGSSAEDTFDAAIRADPRNADAKHNLELLLRRMKVIGSREGAGGATSGYYGRPLPGAGAGLPGTGY